MASTHIRTSRLVVSLVAACLCVPVAARPVQAEGRVRLASPQEGEAVVQAAWELRRGLSPKPDCSHFVHAIYARAGFDYAYASSHEVFDGIDSFRRVQRPQPGDLVVWQHHIGIVVDPDEHSFYSSVLSGFAIENYRSNYWASRGRPRFYRYMVDSEVHRARVLVQGGAKQGMSALKQQPASDSSVAPRLDSDAPDSGANEFPTGNITSRSAPSNTKAFDAVFVSLQAKPSKDDVLAAIIRLADVTGERLLRGASLGSQPAVAVADDFKVVELNINDRSGSAELEVKEAASIQYGFADLKPATSKCRAVLRREKRGWVLVVPQDRIYLRRDLAIQALANHLAVMSRTPANRQELQRVVRVLDELLAEKSAHAAPAGLQ